MDYARFRFERRFDPAQAAELEPPPPAEEPVDPLDVPIYSERALRAEVAAARGEAFENGIAQGREEGESAARSTIQATLADVEAELNGRLAALDDRFEETMRRLEAQGAAVVVTLVRRFAPRILDRLGQDEVEAVAEEAMRAAGAAPSLRIRVNPGMAEAIRARLDRLAANGGYALRFDVVPDSGLAPHAVDAAWDTGGLTFDPSAVERTIDGLCDRALAALDESFNFQTSKEAPTWLR